MNPIFDIAVAHPSVPDLSAIRFRHLTNDADIQHVHHLRDEILLPADVRMSPAFVAGEKKRSDRGGRRL